MDEIRAIIAPLLERIGIRELEPSDTHVCMREHCPVVVEVDERGCVRASVDTGSSPQTCDRCYASPGMPDDQWGWLRGDDGRLAPCPARRKMDRADLLTRAAIPAVFREAVDAGPSEGAKGELARFAPTETELADARRGSRTWGRQGRWLWGETGRGKSWRLASWAGYLTLQLGIPCLWVDVQALLGRLRTAVHGRTDEPTEAELLRPLIEAPVLILDDVWRLRSDGGLRSDHELRIIEQVVAARESRRRGALFLSSNLSPEDAVRRVGPSAASICSRLAGLAQARMVSGHDHRPEVGAIRWTGEEVEA